MTFSLRSRLLALVAIAILSSGVALYAILRLANTGTEQRIERVRDGINREIDRLRDVGSSGLPTNRPPRMRGHPCGFLDRQGNLINGFFPLNLRSNLQETLHTLALESQQSKTTAF